MNNIVVNVMVSLACFCLCFFARLLLLVYSCDSVVIFILAYLLTHALMEKKIFNKKR